MNAATTPPSPATDAVGLSVFEPESQGHDLRLRLDIAYEGTHFSGWARQAALLGQEPVRTVQCTLEQALQTVLRLLHPPGLTVAGRTDAGVHARGQVAHVDLPRAPVLALRPGLLQRLAGVLPPDVRVRRVSQAPAGFDARFSALARHYIYRLWVGQAGPDPLVRRHVLAVANPLHVQAMAEAAQLLVGEHDFAAYCKKRPASFRGQASTIRRLLRCEVRPVEASVDEQGRVDQGLVEVAVSADAFCHSMVRALVGALVVVGVQRRDPQWPQRVLQTGQRDSAVQVLAPTGLTLERVDYPPDDQLQARAVQTRRFRGPTLPLT